MAVDKNYATLAQLKAWRTSEKSDRDDMLNTALGAASRQIDAFCGRRFWLDEVASTRVFNARDNLVVDGDGARLLVDDIGATAGLLVEQGGGSSWTDVTSGLELLPLNATADLLAIDGLLSSTGWTVGPSTRVRITARWGWPAVPDDVRQACLLLASALVSRKDSPQGVLGVAEWGTVRVGKMDPHAQELLLPYRLIPVG